MFLAFLKVAVSILRENDEMAEFLNRVVSHPCRSLAHLLCYTLAKRAEDWILLIRDKRISL